MKKAIEWFRFVITPNVWPERWQDRLFRGHVNIGPVTIYGANAMHWTINIYTTWGYVCFHPPTRTFGGRWPWYFYVSRDGTPFETTFSLNHHRAMRAD